LKTKWHFLWPTVYILLCSVCHTLLIIVLCRAAAEKQPLNAMVDQAVQEKQWAKEDQDFTKFACALKLCVAFAANVGGVGTLIGCGPNIVVKGQVDS